MQIEPIDLADADTLAAVHALVRRSYAIEAAITGIAAIPALTESAAQLAACGETFLGARTASGELAAICSYRLEHGVLDLHRVAVDPGHLRRGIGRRLLETVLGLPHATAVVSTGAGNLPARALYEGAGFRYLGTVAVAPDVTVWRFCRP